MEESRGNPKVRIMVAIIAAVAVIGTGILARSGVIYQTDKPIESTILAETAIAKMAKLTALLETNIPKLTEDQLLTEASNNPAIEDTIQPQEVVQLEKTRTSPPPESKESDSATPSPEPIPLDSATPSAEPTIPIPETPTYFIADSETLPIDLAGTGQFFGDEITIAIIEVTQDGKVSVIITAPGHEVQTFINKFEGSELEYLTEIKYEIFIDEIRDVFGGPDKCTITVRKIGNFITNIDPVTIESRQSRPIISGGSEKFINDELTVEVLNSNRLLNTVSLRIYKDGFRPLTIENKYVGTKEKYLVDNTYEIQVLGIKDGYPDLVTVIVYKLES